MNCKSKIIILLNNRFKVIWLYKKKINKEKRASPKMSLVIDKAT